ncbi:hypothetical protein [Streptomyces europaeiscabiei]|uniref:hypothetical protein n=1 Tax=Streptomyces europaeiscabiei TaxID=146819 RepID=UPI000E68995B|nr:hypothetical protein [Streptomyces europaeiscabiei]
MSRTDRIAEIHRRRARQTKALERAHTWVTESLDRLRELEVLRTELLGRVPDDARSRLTALGAEVSGLLEELPIEAAALDAAAARFRRPTLNVGVIGRARQGKSRLIQSLTGLTNQEVPTSDGGFCTGVTSVLRHKDGVTTQAEVYFHTEHSFLREVIAPYYAELRLGPAPTTLDRFAGPLPLEPAGDKSEEGSRYSHLVQFHTALPEYRHFLGMASPHHVGSHEIRRFVAQSDEHDQPFNAFRAVRYVRITTHFAHQDWTGLSLIDLPGLDDTNLQDAQRIVAALREEIDIVVFVRRPDPLGDGIGKPDHQLYDHVQEGLPATGLNRCSFLLINKCAVPTSDNSANARRMAEQWLPASRFTVAEAHIADCSQPDNVAAAMDRVLDYLLANLDELDDRLLVVRTEKAAELHERLGHLAAQAAHLADLAQPTEIWFLPFTTLFKNTHAGLAHGLASLVRKLRDERDLTDDLLADAMETVLEAAERDPSHPAVDELVARAAAEDGLSMAYGKYLNESRARLSRRFLECDVALHARTSDMQRRVADVLRGPAGLGGLSGAPNGREFLLEVTARVPRVREDGSSEIRYALQLLAGFQLSYRGMLQHRVRACLDGLHADTPAMPFPHQPGPTAQQVREMLEVAYDEALYQCRSDLHKALAEPSAAIFAIVEEFYDRVIASAGAEEEWLVFYQDARAEIWPGKFAALAEDAAHLRRWSEGVAALAALAAPSGTGLLSRTPEEVAA